MKRTKIYRAGAAFMAALMVLTCMPQTSLYAWAEETSAEPEASEDKGVEIGQEQMIVQTEEITGQTAAPTAESTEESSTSPEKTETQEADAEPKADPADPPAKEPVPVATITLASEKLTIQRLDSADIKYTLAPTNADVDTDKKVTFSSADPTVATVAPTEMTAMSGSVSVVANGVGTTTITATTGNGKTASCVVEVTPIPVEKVIIEPAALNLDMNPDEKGVTKSSGTLSVIVLPENADNKNVSLRPNYDDKVIEVDDKDLNTTKKITVTAKKGGWTTLSVVSQDNNKIYGSCEVTVEGKVEPLTGLSAKPGYPKNLYEGSSVNLTSYVTYEPVNATDKKLTWSIDNESDQAYADVNPNTGRVTAKWKTDESKSEHDITVTATATNGETVSFEIKIKRKNVSLKALYVTPAELTLEDAGSKNSRTISVQLDPLTSTEREITATVSGEDGKMVALINAGRSYDAEEAKATAEAEADVNGRAYFTVTANELEGLKKQDTCTITFVKKGADATAAATIKARCNVTVNKFVTPVDELLLNEALSIEDGEEAPLTATIKPLTAEDRNIVWTVDDPEIASIVGVDADGKIEATKKDAAADGLTATVTVKANMVGKCKITATAAGDVTKTCIVTVGENDHPATGLTITSAGVPDGETTEITLKKGQTYTLIPNVTPDSAANKKVKWTASSLSGVITSAVASVDKSGVVTANALGDCVITAQASGSAAECTKTVQVHVVSPHMEVTYPKNWSYVPEDQPIEEETLRRELQVSFYPIEKPIPEQDKWVLASGEPHDYELKILGEDGKTKKLYTKEDMETPGVKVLLVCFTYDGVTYEKSVPVEMKEFDEADLISVTQLSGDEAEVWNVPNATPASALPLAKTTEIVVGRKTIVDGKEELKTSRLQAEIEWRVSESGYDPANSEAQDFTVFGEVKLPDYVTNTENKSRRVQALVHVREQAASGKKAARPTFSVLGGEQIRNQTTVTLPYGSKIVLESATDEAEIYYMVDRRPDEDRGVPKDAEHRYKSPIEITARTTTIYAVAVKHGFIDSDCSECTIKLVRAETVDPEDPDAPLPDDVENEDREQIGGKVPDGLWAAVQMSAEEKKDGGFAYTGKAIKPAVHVYDRTMLLTEKTDYTVAYSNNVNAGSAKGSAKPPTITVTGRGNYEGKALVYFTIKPQSIEDDAVLMDESVAVAYNKKAQKPNPALTWNGKKLSKNRDYTYADTSYTEPGVYKITVTGNGNYTGERTMTYEIYDGGVAISKLTFSKIANQKYTGTEIRPVVEVKNKKVILKEGTEKGNTGNYWVKYENCTKVGNASVVIIGKGNYKGSKRINFKILPVAKINQAGITLDIPATGVAFTGKPYTPKCIVNYAGTELKENQDYKLSYQNNIKAGTATVVITGMGPYTGTAKKTFKILQNDISGLTAVMGSSFAYEKGGCKPKPEVTCNGLKLKEGTDYTLTYRNHNKIGNTASVTIKGKGNYKGQIVRYFEVTMQDLANLKVVAADKVFQNKKNIYKTKVQVIDLNGQVLTAGTDYAKDIYYTYESGAKAGQPVLSTDIIPAGTVIGVDVRVATPRCYQGTIHGTYRIVQADISGAKVSINPQEYTGRSIRPKKSQIQVTLKGVLLRNDDYEIVGYENNVKQGNAKITIRGVGGYGGTKTATFKIKKKGILNLKF